MASCGDIKESSTGGFSCGFIENQNIPKWLHAECPVCLQILREPHQVICCGKNYCKTCIDGVKLKRNQCPCCKMEDFKIFHNKSLQQTLYTEFKVYCSNQKSGCKWVGSLGEVDSHLNMSPPQEKELEGCQFVQVECSHCSVSYLRSELEVHKNNNCSKRPFSCEYCKNLNATYEEVIFHWNDCGSFPVPCPNKCNLTLERRLIDDHIANDCPETIVDCDFKHFGCDVKLPRRELSAHISESLTLHMTLMLQFMTRLEAENRQLKDEIARLRISTPTTVLNLTMNHIEKHIKEGTPWFSPSFYTQGYKLRLQVYVSNDGDSDNICTTIFVCMMMGRLDECLKWPFRGTVVVELLKESGGVVYTAKICHEGQRITTGTIGFGKGVSHIHDNLKRHITNDRLHFRIPAVQLAITDDSDYNIVQSSDK